LLHSTFGRIRKQTFSNAYKLTSAVPSRHGPPGTQEDLMLAALLLAKVISPVVGAVILAVCLVSLGIMSGGFRRQ
jgi:integral membrane sensor domain MASE1